ncbi:STAS domain-containing protein [Streptomyces sp. NPDC088725]|uniref:STAS domain-containing protein n=1 Tax=Streptomyces sp. NPDC088725 TaxID=3365873 RepID=UPI0037F8D164
MSAVSVGVDPVRPIVLVLTGRLTSADVPGLCDALTARLAAEAGDGSFGGREVICEVGGLVRPGLAAVDALARMQLTARGHGYRIRLRGADQELRLMLELAGLPWLAADGP